MTHLASKLEEIVWHQNPVSESVWERRGRLVGAWLPYVTLASATTLAMFQSNQTWQEQAGTLALSVLAGVWVYGMYTRLRRDHSTQRVRVMVYFAGFLLLASVLMSRQTIFFVFAVTGLLHAAELRPWPLIFLGVGLTSILINTITTGFPWQTRDSWLIFGAIIILQTLIIGFGSLLSNRLNMLSEQRRQAVSQLEAALDENAGLHAQLLTQAREAGVLEERQRMAREIHDTLAQDLIGIITQLEAAQQANTSPENDWQRHLENAVHLAREGLAEARRSVNALHPEPLESARLPDALKEVAQRWSALNNMPLEVGITGDPIKLHPEIEAALLRTAQEALTNISKHAHASRAGLTLCYMGDVVTLDIRDDGIGFDLPASFITVGKGYGLLTMRQRVNRVAGSLEIESEPGSGTAVSARVPSIPV